MRIVYLLILLLSLSTSAVDVTTTEVEKMLDSMVEQGTITKEDAEKAKARARGMTHQEWKGLINKADQVMEANNKAEKAMRGIASEQVKN